MVAALAVGASLLTWSLISIREVPYDSPVCHSRPPASVRYPDPSQQFWCQRSDGSVGTWEDVSDDRRTAQDDAVKGLIAGALLLVVGLWIGIRLRWPAKPKAPRAVVVRDVGHPSPVSRAVPAPTRDDYRLLVLMCGSPASAESLIALERRYLPHADRVTLIVKAIERLRRDRDRHG